MNIPRIVVAGTHSREGMVVNGIRAAFRRPYLRVLGLCRKAALDIFLGCLAYRGFVVRGGLDRGVPGFSRTRSRAYGWLHAELRRLSHPQTGLGAGAFQRSSYKTF